MTLFHAEMCYYMAGEHEASAGRLCSCVRQFLIYSAFVVIIYDVKRIASDKLSPKP